MNWLDALLKWPNKHKETLIFTLLGIIISGGIGGGLWVKKLKDEIAGSERRHQEQLNLLKAKFVLKEEQFANGVKFLQVRSVIVGNKLEPAITNLIERINALQIRIKESRLDLSERERLVVELTELRAELASFLNELKTDNDLRRLFFSARSDAPVPFSLIVSTGAYAGAVAAGLIALLLYRRRK